MIERGQERERVENNTALHEQGPQLIFIAQTLSAMDVWLSAQRCGGIGQLCQARCYGLILCLFLQGFQGFIHLLVRVSTSYAGSLVPEPFLCGLWFSKSHRNLYFCLTVTAEVGRILSG